MKKLYFIGLLMATVTLISFTRGSDGGYTGSIGDGGTTCASSWCHSSVTNYVDDSWITTTIPESGFVPGTIYTINLNATFSCGVEITSENSAGTKVGTFILNSSETKMKLIPNTAATHDNQLGTSFSIKWRAPENEAGPVRFNACFCNKKTLYTSETSVSKSTYTPVIATKEEVTFQLYPNPVVDRMNIRLHNEAFQPPLQLKVFSLSGKELLNRTVQKPMKEPMELDVSTLESGAYTVVLQSKERRTSSKFIKQ